MELFDTHFHYYGETSPGEYFRNIMTAAAVPPQSLAGVPDKLYLMAAGGDYLESCRSREFAQVIETAYFAAGVHPHNAEKFFAEANDFTEFKSHPKLKALGELGLDYFYEHSSREAQKKMFEHFLNIALAWDLPAIVHLRDRESVWDAYEDGYNLLDKFARNGGRFVVHCFSGTPMWAEKFLEIGAYLGVTGIVTFNRAQNIREALAVIPDERLLIETDSPYLAPVPHRGSENNPGFLALIAAYIAKERQSEIETIAKLTTANAMRFYNIGEEER
ncbi:MAG: TatD family hydrolase [Victivallales bacterium]|nr:TatD family hydrolase [Victivallales bacterium]